MAEPLNYVSPLFFFHEYGRRVGVVPRSSLNSGLNSRKKCMAARVCALAKSQRSRQMDFTSLLPVTSGHCTEWQKPGHNASPGHWYALTQV